MEFIPWRHIADWKCNACSSCCRLYSVVLGFPEWLKIVKVYDVEKTVAGLDKLYLKRACDGSCSFLYHFGKNCYCGLQHMKPAACKLWPFKILPTPKYGHANEAVFNYPTRKLFIYADSMCAGLRYGSPTWSFQFSTLREFTEIAFGTRWGQLRTTGNMSFVPPNWLWRYQVR